jgi:hypothetical protein
VIRSKSPTHSGHKKSAPKIRSAFFIDYRFPLAGRNGVNRAGIEARTAVGAGVWIDYKLVITLADSFHRAGGFTGAAGNAFT